MNGAVLLNSWILGVGIWGYSGLWVTSYLLLQIDIWGWCWGLFRVRGDLLPVVPDRYLGVWVYSGLGVSLTCCSRVMTVWTLTVPCSQGSVIPTDPGKKNPADNSWRHLLGDTETKDVVTRYF